MAESQSFQDLLTCSVCLEKFTFPKVLPCQHTFCVNCLRGIARNAKKLSCPQCRQQHQIPDKGVDGLPDNFTIKNLLSMFSVTAQCGDCKSETSLTECGHCQQSVCAGCRMSHEQLVRDLQDKLRVTEGASNVPDNGRMKMMQLLLDQIHTEQNRIPKSFDDRRQQLNQAQNEALSYFDILETKVKVILREEKGTLEQSIQQRVSECKTTSSLKKLKAVLENTERTMGEVQRSKDDKVTLAYEYDAVDGCGRVCCGDKVVEIGRVGGGDGTSKSALENALPSQVNYEAKISVPKMYIERHPVAGKRLRPLSAVYCKSTDSIYCISEGKKKWEGEVLVIGMDGRVSEVLSSLIQSARHLAIAQSGNLVVLESSKISIIDLSGSSKFKNVILRREVCIPFSSQVGCHGREFVVLNAGKKSLVFYTEEGERLRQVGIPENITQKSKLAIGGDGRVYVTTEGFKVVGREEKGELKGCHERKKSIVHVSVGQQVAVIPWGGGPQQTVTLRVGAYITSYAFNKQCRVCYQHTARNDGSVRTDSDILEEHERMGENDIYIRGLCVDADGFTTFSVNGLAGLQVTDPKHARHSCISTPEERPGFFLDARGVSLMPDGRLIVCDYGHDKIQIL